MDPFTQNRNCDCWVCRYSKEPMKIDECWHPHFPHRGNEQEERAKQHYRELRAAICERDALRRDNDSLQQGDMLDIEQILENNKLLHDKATKLRAALLRYGVHENNCTAVPGPGCTGLDDIDCTCGFSDALGSEPLQCAECAKSLAYITKLRTDMDKLNHWIDEWKGLLPQKALDSLANIRG